MGPWFLFTGSTVFSQNADNLYGLPSAPINRDMSRFVRCPAGIPSRVLKQTRKFPSLIYFQSSLPKYIRFELEIWNWQMENLFCYLARFHQAYTSWRLKNISRFLRMNKDCSCLRALPQNAGVWIFKRLIRRRYLSAYLAIVFSWDNVTERKLPYFGMGMTLFPWEKQLNYTSDVNQHFK